MAYKNILFKFKDWIFLELMYFWVIPRTADERVGKVRWFDSAEGYTFWKFSRHTYKPKYIGVLFMHSLLGTATNVQVFYAHKHYQLYEA